MWGEKRPFPIDMAGFAVNLNLILAHPSARFSQHVPRGMQESHFLSHLISVQDLECKAENATKIYVWHTQTQNVLLVGERSMEKKNLVYDKNILNQI
jgi:predicted PilT family ATPase